jgi:hypothetical protein
VELHDRINSFRPIGLAEMDTVALVNRIDTKFVFPRSMLETVMAGLTSDYRILEINGIRNHIYDSLYFDDTHHSLYLMHHNERGHRFKLRLRKYGSTGSVFMEVKKKTNTGRTVKERKKTHVFTELADPSQLEFFSSAGGRVSDWVYSLRIGFNRITLVSIDPPERVTLDIDLHVEDRGGHFPLGGSVIAEVKQGSRANSVFLSLMKRMRIQSGSISKYCLAVTLLKKNIKFNLFKSRRERFLRVESNHNQQL